MSVIRVAVTGAAGQVAYPLLGRLASGEVFGPEHKVILQLLEIPDGMTRLEAASRRGNDIGATTYGSIKSILQNGLDRAYANSKAPDAPPIRHANIRGRGYYH